MKIYTNYMLRNKEHVSCHVADSNHVCVFLMAFMP